MCLPIINHVALLSLSFRVSSNWRTKQTQSNTVQSKDDKTPTPLYPTPHNSRICCLETLNETGSIHTTSQEPWKPKRLYYLKTKCTSRLQQTWTNQETNIIQIAWMKKEESYLFTTKYQKNGSPHAFKALFWSTSKIEKFSHETQSWNGYKHSLSFLHQYPVDRSQTLQFHIKLISKYTTYTQDPDFFGFCFSHLNFLQIRQEIKE
jgi:hypothetical protein